MEQLQAMLKKAVTDKVFMSKLEELSRINAAPEEIVAFAADYGFTIKKEDLEAAVCNGSCVSNEELGEEQLEQISGGGGIYPTQDRYDPNVCPNLTRTRYECVGFLQFINCDHYKRDIFSSRRYGYWHHCNKFGFPSYRGDYHGNHEPD